MLHIEIVVEFLAIIQNNAIGLEEFFQKTTQFLKSKFVVNYLQHLEVMEFKRKKRMEERARESREAKEKRYEDYPWAELCEDVTKLKKLRVQELDKYLKHHGLK